MHLTIIIRITEVGNQFIAGCKQYSAPSVIGRKCIIDYSPIRVLAYIIN